MDITTNNNSALRWAITKNHPNVFKLLTSHLSQIYLIIKEFPLNCDITKSISNLMQSKLEF